MSIKSFRVRLFLSFWSVALLLLVWISLYFFLNKRESKRQEIVEVINNTQQQYLHQNNMFQQFMLTGYREPSFYFTGNQVYLDSFSHYLLINKNLLNEIQNTSLITELGVAKEIRDIAGMNNNLLDSLKIFKKLYLERGFKDYGFEGTMRNYAHTIEEKKLLPEKDILQLRRHEKDYIIRADLMYVKQFTKLIDEDINATTNSIVKENLEGYRLNFLRYVANTERIGTMNNNGLYGYIVKGLAMQEMAYSIVKFKTQNELAALHNNIRTVFIASFLTLLILLFLLSNYLSKLLSKDINALTFRVTKFLESNFTDSIEKIEATNDRFSIEEFTKLNDGFAEIKTKLQHSLSEMKDSFLNFRTVFEATNIGYILLTEQFVVTAYNAKAKNYLQQKFNIAINEKEILQIKQLATGELISEALVLSKIAHHEVCQIDIAKNDEGVTEWYNIKYSPVTNKVNDIVGILFSIDDISERKNAETELQQSVNLVTDQNKRLQNFSYIVSHNLRSHTSNIKGILHLMNMPIANTEKEGLITHLGTVANALDDTLLHLNKVVDIQNANKVHVEPVDLNEYVQKAIYILSEKIKIKDARIENLVPEGMQVQHNPAYIESILQNFISNALKYSHVLRKPHIKLYAYTQTNGKVLLQISDNGIGIDLNKNGDKLFGMYKTFSNNRDAKGIGLFITKNQIEAMGGTIEVESIIDVGTTFKINFA